MSAHAAANREAQSIYIRFGRWSSRSMDHSKHERLAGVSVYRAQLVEGNLVRLVDEASEQLNGQGRLVFVVTGKYVDDGPAGEPLLRSVREVKRVAIEMGSIPQRVKI